MHYQVCRSPTDHDTPLKTTTVVYTYSFDITGLDNRQAQENVANWVTVYTLERVNSTLCIYDTTEHDDGSSCILNIQTIQGNNNSDPCLNGSLCRNSLRVVHSQHCVSEQIWSEVANVVVETDHQIMQAFRSNRAQILLDDEAVVSFGAGELNHISLEVVQKGEPAKRTIKNEEAAANGRLKLNLGGLLTVIASAFVLVGVGILLVLGCKRCCRQRRSKMKLRSSPSKNRSVDKWQTYVSKASARALLQASKPPISDQIGTSNDKKHNELAQIAVQRSGTDSSNSSLDAIECGVHACEESDEAVSDQEYPIVTRIRRIAIVPVDTFSDHVWDSNSRDRSIESSVLHFENPLVQHDPSDDVAVVVVDADTNPMEAVETSLLRTVDSNNAVKIETMNSSEQHLDLESTTSDTQKIAADNVESYTRAMDESIDTTHPSEGSLSKRSFDIVRFLTNRFQRPSVDCGILECDLSLLDEAVKLEAVQRSLHTIETPGPLWPDTTSVVSSQGGADMPLAISNTSVTSVLSNKNEDQSVEVANKPVPFLETGVAMSAPTTSVLDGACDQPRNDQEAEAPKMVQSETWSSDSSDVLTVDPGDRLLASELLPSDHSEQDVHSSYPFGSFICRKGTVFSEPCAVNRVCERSESHEFHRLWSESEESTAVSPFSSEATEEITKTRAPSKEIHGSNDKVNDADRTDSLEYPLAMFESSSICYVRTDPPERDWSSGTFLKSRSLQL